MKHLKEFGKLNEGVANAMVSFTDNEFTYEGFEFIASFEAEANTYYEAPTREEGHGYHDIGGGVNVEDVNVTVSELGVNVLDTYIDVKDQTVIDKIEKYLADQQFVSDSLAEEIPEEDYTEE